MDVTQFYFFKENTHGEAEEKETPRYDGTVLPD